MDRMKLIFELKRDEGIKSTVYMDSMGIPTIGVGRNLRDTGLSISEVDFLLGNDIDRTLMSLDASAPWWRKLNEVRQRVIVNMAFNLGTARLLQFNAMIAAIQREDFKTASAEMLNSHWAQQVGHRALRLSRIMAEGT
jgi:lysozyme